MKPGQRGGPVPWCISFGAVAVHGWRRRPVVRAENQCLIELLTPDTIDMQPIMTGHTGSHQRSSRDASGPPGGTDKPCGDADGGTGAWLRCFIPNNLIIFNIITQPSWWSSSNLNQHVLVAEPLKVDHLIAKNYLVRFGLMKFSYVMSALTFKLRSDSRQIREHSSVVVSQSVAC